jgi:two-component system, NtrC family, sensor kinase
MNATKPLLFLALLICFRDQWIATIFQPFFTTKPTGQGTGLGLSLSYDIVKAHGRELKVETKEGEGSTFNIELPIIH